MPGPLSIKLEKDENSKKHQEAQDKLKKALSLIDRRNATDVTPKIISDDKKPLKGNYNSESDCMDCWIDYDCECTAPAAPDIFKRG